MRPSGPGTLRLVRREAAADPGAIGMVRTADSELKRGVSSGKVIVATTVALSFISFWRAAAIVLGDLASSAFYVGGIAETAIGKSAPWFILGIMLFSYAVRALYIESCSMFVRGGVYKVVQAAMGPAPAKFSVSALMFDYMLTGPISGISAGLYLAGLLNDLMAGAGLSVRVNPPALAVSFAVAVTLYFWRKNLIGIHESSGKALRIMQVATIMVATLIVWCLVTIAVQGYAPVPLPSHDSIRYGPHALGWLEGTALPGITAIAVLIGFGHSLLAMSGEETLAQVNREICFPRLKNLQRAGLVIFLYSLLFTSLVSFFAVMIIPDAERGKYLENLIGGLAMHLAGPISLKLLFHGFVVVVGVLMLSGAVNTSLIGSNGVLNRVAEDGVLSDWFRQPHPRYGTTFRLLNLVVVLQLITIVLSRGDVYLLGEAYAFGVIWSFVMKSCAVLVLRYRQPGNREWRVPLNFEVRGIHVPLGLILIAATLLVLALVNLVTKQIATISGLSFAACFFMLFELSERYNRRHRKGAEHQLEKFVLDEQPELGIGSFQPRPGCVVAAVRDPQGLEPLHWALERTDTDAQDLVVLHTRLVSAGEGEYELDKDQYFQGRERELFTSVVAMAEKAGKTVRLLVIPATAPLETLVYAAARLRCRLLVVGAARGENAAEMARQIGLRWELLSQPRPRFSLAVVGARQHALVVKMGPHTPDLWQSDVRRVHTVWLNLSQEDGFGAALHHRDVLSLALKRFERDLNSTERQEILTELRGELPKISRDK